MVKVIIENKLQSWLKNEKLFWTWDHSSVTGFKGGSCFVSCWKKLKGREKGKKIWVCRGCCCCWCWRYVKQTVQLKWRWLSSSATNKQKVPPLRAPPPPTLPPPHMCVCDTNARVVSCFCRKTLRVNVVSVWLPKRNRHSAAFVLIPLIPVGRVVKLALLVLPLSSCSLFTVVDFQVTVVLEAFKVCV